MKTDLICEPIFLNPIYKEKIWGGEQIKNVFHRKIENNKIGESWEISANHNGDNTIINSNYNTMTLSELFENNKYLFGKNSEKYEKFPLLIKYLDAHDKLSVQLHSLSEKHHKDECWYILDAKEDAEIIYGLKDNLTKEEFEKIIKNNELKKYLNYKKVKKGDFIYINSGLIHALLKGVFLIEIQQNSDTTYRIYDWDREEKRELHIKESIDNLSEIQLKEDKFPNYDGIIGEQLLVNNNYFNISKVFSLQQYKNKLTENSFLLINIIKGENITLIFDNKKYILQKGQSFILPACDKNYEIIGNVEFIKTWI